VSFEVKVLLTGGVGYLGGRLAEFLAAHTEHDVVLGTRTPERAPAWAKSYPCVRTDWTEPTNLFAACKNVEAIVHLVGMNAACSAADPPGALEVNGLGTARLLRAACDAGVRRFIYLSTAHVYGDSLTGIVDEVSCPRPRHPYATSHRAGEDAVRAASFSTGIEGLVVRLSNAYGAPADCSADCWSLLTNDLCLQSVRTQRLTLRTKGDQRRDFVPLGEVCRALAHLLSVPASTLKNNETVNLGGGWAPTLREMAMLVGKRSDAVLGFHPEVVSGSTADATGGGLIEYRVTRLLASGFEQNPNALIAEMDGLIRFCHRNRESLP
jgi:UDP-glucose 4-epimerase